jgi:hypothetical protein
MGQTVYPCVGTATGTSAIAEPANTETTDTKQTNAEIRDIAASIQFRLSLDMTLLTISIVGSDHIPSRTCIRETPA